MRVGLLLLLLVACGSQDPLQEAQGLMKAGRFEEASAVLAELLSERPDDAEVQYRYGESLRKAGSPSEAVWSLRRAMQDPEWRVEAGLQLTSAAIATGNFDEAVSAANIVLGEEPDNVGGLILRTIARVQTRRDYAGALEDAERVLELEPDHEAIPVYRTVALLGLGRVEEAAEALEQLELDATDGVIPGPMAAGLCGARAKFALESGEFEEAEELYSACQEQFPTNAYIVQDFVEFLDASGRVEDATAVLRTAHEAAPRLRGPRVSLVVRLQSVGALEEAEALLREAARDVDALTAATAHADLAGFLVDHARYEEAVASFERALELGGENAAGVYFPYADALVMAGRTQDALAAAEKVEHDAPRRLLIGRALLAEGRAQEALDALTEALKAWPNQAMARYYAALAAEQLGDFERAVEEYRYAIRAGAVVPEVRTRLAQLHFAQGRTDLALSALRQTDGALDLASALLEVEILASSSDSYPPLRPILQLDANMEDAFAALATGARRREGPGGAVGVLLDPDFQISGRLAGVGLRTLVDDLVETGRGAEAYEMVMESIDAAGETALLRALESQTLLATGADPMRARKPLERALELDEDLPRAREIRARLRAEAGDVDGALVDYAAAAEAAGPYDPGTAALAAAEVLVSAGRLEEAQTQLSGWLALHPLDAAVSLRLAALLAGDEDKAAEALALAERAVALRGGEEADALAAQLRGEARRT